MDNLRFSLEHFAQDGSYLTTDAGSPIVSSGSYMTGSGAVLEFRDVDELGGQASTACEAITCFSRGLLEDARSSADLSGGDLQGEEIALVARAIDQANGNLRQAIVEVVTSDRFLAP